MEGEIQCSRVGKFHPFAGVDLPSKEPRRAANDKFA